MNIFPRGTLLLLPLLLAACSSPQQAAPTAPPPRTNFPEASATYASLRHDIPPGTSIVTAQSTLTARGFVCAPAPRSNGYEVLECLRDEPVRPGLVRRWRVTVLHLNGSVSDLQITNDLTAVIQAREASQPPTR